MSSRHGMYTTGALSGARLIALALIFFAAGAANAGGADSTDPKHTKASSFAPHKTKRHAYGAPVSKPILHKGKKRKPPAAAGAPAKPVK